MDDVTPSARPTQVDRTGLRPGWTTGACATAAATASYTAMLTGQFPDPVEVLLPRGHRPAFALTWTRPDFTCAVTKDAGDDPDVTHGAVVWARVAPGVPGAGVTFHAGEGVGTVTLPGLPLEVGEPAINPMPRRFITEHLQRVADAHRCTADVVVTIGIERGEEIAHQTWNPRLGILGGLSVLGTTGVVVPYSCAAWIDSIHRGIDVARALGHSHVAGCTGSTSEATVARLYDLAPTSLLDMGDFVGAVLKYVRRHPIPRLTLGGGFAKMSKLAAGHLDLHSGRSQVNTEQIAELAAAAGAGADFAYQVRQANTGLHALQIATKQGFPLGDVVAQAAAHEAHLVLGDCGVAVDVVCTDRAGDIVGRSTVVT